MKIIIAGSRGITDGLEEIMELSAFNVSAVVSGGARGVDRLGEAWASESGIPVVRFLPAWDKFGRAAGGFRNSSMADYADGAVILWDGQSAGTLDMIDKMRRRGKPMEVWIWDGSEFEYVPGTQS